MLNFMRKNANSWVMILLFGIIIFVFAINFGPWAGNISPSASYAALVNNETISLAEFRSAYSSQFARIKQFRTDYDETQAERDGLKKIVLEQLIARELLNQLGRQHQLSIGALTLAQEIKLRVFGEEAEFNKDEYTRRIHAFFQSTVAQFEEQVSKEIVAEQMASLLGTSVFVSDAEVLMAYQDKNTKVSLEFIKVNPEHFVVSRTISAEDTKRYAEANGKKISEYYNENLGEYVKDEEVRASHILVKVPSGASEAEKATLKEKAQKILARVKANEDFAQIAKAESEDAGTKEKGGDLDFFSKGMMVENFANAAFALKPGQVSDVVETQFGFHIIKVTDQKAKMERKLEEVSTEIAEKLIKAEEQEQKAKQMARAALDQLKAGTALENIKLAGLINVKAGDKQPAADSNAPIADQTDMFNLSSSFIYKLGRADAISQEAFKLSMAKRTADEVVESNGEFFALRLKSREDADMSKFEEQKESIKSSLVLPRRRALMQQSLSQLKERAKITYNQALMTAPDASI